MATLADFLAEHEQTILEHYTERVRSTVQRYSDRDPGTFPENTRRLIRLLPLAAAQPDAPAIEQYVGELCHERFPEGFSLGDILTAMFLYDDIILPIIWDHVEQGPQRRDLVLDLENAIETVALQFAKEYVDTQRTVLEEQRRAVLELSTPVIKVWDGILALPLVGTVDTYRARQIMEELLSAIVTQQASIVLIDITGVPMVDTMVAHHLIKTIRAAELLGAECLLVGLGPTLSQTVVSLGIDLSNITSAADMRQGLTLAFDRLQLQVVRTDGKPRPR